MHLATCTDSPLLGCLQAVVLPQSTLLLQLADNIAWCTAISAQQVSKGVLLLRRLREPALHCPASHHRAPCKAPHRG